VDVRVWASRVPVLDAAWDLVRQRVVPGGTYRNLRAAARYARWAPDLSEEVQLVLCDAQTSGGLVMAVAPDRAGRLEAALARRRVPVVAEVGEVVGPGHGVVYVS
jgi:selenide,water dikinase